MRTPYIVQTAKHAVKANVFITNVLVGLAFPLMTQLFWLLRAGAMMAIIAPMLDQPQTDDCTLHSSMALGQGAFQDFLQTL